MTVGFSIELEARDDTVEELAAPGVLFLASDEARMVIDAGFAAQ